MATILIVDDDDIFQAQMGLYMDRLGHDCLQAGTLQQGLEAARANRVDVVFLDVYLPDASGLDAISRFRSVESLPEVIIITAWSDPDSAEMAVRNGAWFYLQKPPAFGSISLTLGRALQYRRAKHDFDAQHLLERDQIVGRSPALKRSLGELARAARSEGNVLVTGETGTGKELFARALHDNSPRRERPLVVVDCTSLPESLVESLLFGHRRGAFTGADQDREGFFAQADGSTLFFDELGDLPRAAQSSLLRVLQEKRFRPLGSTQETSSDFRVVAVTNRDLKALVDSGEFRSDLYYRLSQHRIHLPPLREREGDLELLVGHYLPRVLPEDGLQAKGVSKEFMSCLARHDWPGNVRELVGVLTAAAANAPGEPVLHPHHLPLELRARHAKQSLDPERGGRAVAPSLKDCAAELFEDEQEFVTLARFREKLTERMEAGYLDRLIAASRGSAKRAVELAAISRARLYQLLQKHGRSLKSGMR